MTVAGTAERYRKVKDFGGWKEIENYIIAPNMGNAGKRAAREKSTKEAVQRVNMKHAVERCEDKIRANFVPGDKYVTFTFQPTAMPDSKAAAVRAWNAFVKRLRRRCDKIDVELKYCKTIEQGERHGHWHIHAIINDAVPYELLRDCWSKCGSLFVESLWGDGNGYANVHNLAEYFVGANKKGKRISEKTKSEKTYSFSANCIDPKVTYEIMSAKWLKTPRVPKGWELIRNSLEEYEDAYGLRHQRYMIVKIAEPVCSSRLTLSDVRIAWAQEQTGQISRADIAAGYGVSVQTLTQAYRRYQIVRKE